MSATNDLAKRIVLALIPFEPIVDPPDVDQLAEDLRMIEQRYTQLKAQGWSFTHAAFQARVEWVVQLLETEEI